MKLLIQSAMIFFGTLMAAGVVALGEPAGSGGEPSSMHDPSATQAFNQLVESARPWVELTSVAHNR
jgi:hypothetical protein